MWLDVKQKTNCTLYNFSIMEEIFKQRLKEEIRMSGLTTVELAKRIGVSPEMITQYYTTDKLPRLDTFTKLCKALDVSADYLLGLSEI